MANYQTPMESLKETPYFDICSVRGYAQDVLKMLDNDLHQIVLTVVSRITKEDQRPVLLLNIDGDIPQEDGSVKHMQATAWSNMEPTAEECEEYAAPKIVADATLRWGAYPDKDDNLVWAKNPKLKSWVTLDGEIRSSQSTKKSWVD